MKVSYETIFRPAFEARAAAIWGATAIYTPLVLGSVGFSGKFTALMTATAMAFSAYRGNQVRQLWTAKLQLAGKAFTLMPVQALQEALPHFSEEYIWLGWGWRWEKSHTQLARDVIKRDLREVYPPSWFLRLSGAGRGTDGRVRDPANEKGKQWIHGLGKEEPVLIPWKALEGHTAILATTGAIKTTLFGVLLYQMAMRGECVIVIDPKGDRDLRALMKRCAELSGDPDRFIEFHPNFPLRSARFDALKSFDRTTEIASRIQAMMTLEGDDSFSSYCWLTIFNVVAATVYVGRRPTLFSILGSIQSTNSACRLLEEAMTKYFKERIPEYDKKIAEVTRGFDPKTSKHRPQKSSLADASDRLLAMIQIYNGQAQEDKVSEISGLIGQMEADRTWFGKMIVQLVPLLSKLTADDMNRALSPRYDDISDSRPVYDVRKIIQGNKLFYLGIDALSDASVASALAALVLSDAASVAGQIYNYDENPGSKKVNFLLDEWGDQLCGPVIQLANKGRGAGYRIFMAGQSYSDAVDKLGSDPKAKRVMANFNNLIAGATNDQDSVELIMSKIGETVIQDVSVSTGGGQKTEDTGLEFSGSRSESIKDVDAELFPPTLLPGLPDLHYVAVVNRGDVYKGRIPKLILEEAVA